MSNQFVNIAIPNNRVTPVADTIKTFPKLIRKTFRQISVTIRSGCGLLGRSFLLAGLGRFEVLKNQTLLNSVWQFDLFGMVTRQIQQCPKLTTGAASRHSETKRKNQSERRINKKWSQLGSVQIGRLKVALMLMQHNGLNMQ